MPKSSEPRGADERVRASLAGPASEWLASAQGRACLDEAMRESEQLLARLAEERRVEPAMLHEPINL